MGNQESNVFGSSIDMPSGNCATSRKHGKMDVSDSVIDVQIDENGKEKTFDKPPVKRHRTRLATDEESISTQQWNELQARCKELERDLADSRRTIELLQQERERLESDRDRVLMLYQKSQSDFSEAQTLHQSAVEQAATLGNEVEKLQRIFKLYRENKEAEVQRLLKIKARLETRLSRLNCILPEDTHMDRNSNAEESVPPSPGFSSRTDWGSMEWDNLSVSGSQSLLQSSVDFALRVDAAAMDDSSIVRSAPVISVYVITDGTYENLRNSFYTQYIPYLRSIVSGEGRVFKSIFLGASNDAVDECLEAGEAAVFVSFVDRTITQQLRRRIQNVFLDNSNAVLAVFCFPRCDGDKKILSKLPLWERLCNDDRTRIVNVEENRNRQLKVVFSEIENFLNTELKPYDAFSMDTENVSNNDEDSTARQNRLSYDLSRCEQLLNSTAFDVFANDFHGIFFKNAERRGQGLFLDRPMCADLLNKHVNVAGPLSPLLIAGSAGVGVTTLLVEWLRSLNETHQEAMFILYHFVTDRKSATADPYSMLRRFNAELRAQFGATQGATRIPLDAECLKQEFMILLEKVAVRFQRGILIVIDRLDLFQHLESAPHCLSWLFDPLPPDCRVVVSCHADAVQSPWRAWPMVQVNLLNPSEISAMFNMQMKRGGGTLNATEARQFAIHFGEKSNVVSLKTPRAVCIIIKLLCKYGRTILAQLADANNFTALIAIVLRRILDSITAPMEQELMKTALLCISNSRDGLTITELTEAVPKLPVEKWFVWFSVLCDFGITRKVCGLNQLTSVEITEAVHAVLSATPKSSIDILSMWKSSWGNLATSWRAIDESLHLLKTNNDDVELRRFLLRPEVFVSLVSRGHISRLMEYWLHLHCDKTAVIQQYADKLGDDGSESFNGLSQLALAVLCQELDLGVSMAVGCFQRALEIYQTCLDNEHPGTGVVLHEMALCYIQNGKSNVAESMLKRAQQIFAGLFGPNHRRVETELETLLQFYRVQSKLKLGEQIEKQLQQLRSRRRQTESWLSISRRLSSLSQFYTDEQASPEAARLLTELGYVHYHRGSLDMAADVFRKALVVKEKLIGETHPDLCPQLHNLAVVYIRKKQYEKAEAYTRRLLSLKQKKTPADENDIALVQQRLVDILCSQTKYSEAEPILSQLVQYYRSSSNRQPGKLASALRQFARLCCEQSQHDKAQPLLEEALRYCQEHFPQGHQLTATIQKDYAKLHFETGNYEEAANMYMKAVQNRQRRSSISSFAPSLPASTIQSSQLSIPSSMATTASFVLAPPPAGKNRHRSLAPNLTN